MNLDLISAPREFCASTDSEHFLLSTFLRRIVGLDSAAALWPDPQSKETDGGARHPVLVRRAFLLDAVSCRR